MGVTSCSPSEKRKFPPCRAACPAGVNVQGYISLLQKGRFSEAVALIRRNMPFPAICGRVCFSPCQDACSRKTVDQAVGIRYLKKLAADIEREQGRIEAAPVSKKYREKVAIIGAGPAGLSAAYELAKLGYPVTVLERMPEPGGMMRYGIPDHRLQKFVVANEIAYIKNLGVQIKTGIEFGKDVTIDTLRNDGYDALFLAIGAQLGSKLDVAGEEFRGVFHAVEFLSKVALGNPVDVGEKMAVIGGGNSAIDAARTALRLGATTVMILYRRSRKEMPALPHEIEAAEEEGIQFQFLVAPTKVIGEKGRVKALECSRMELGAPDASGRRSTVPVKGTEHTYDVDTVIAATGQTLETACLPASILDQHGRWIAVDPLTLETNIPGVFAGGDVVYGSSSVIEAISAGKGAALSIDRYLNGKDLREGRDEEVEETTWVLNWEKIAKKPPRYSEPHLDTGRRKVTFEEADELLVKAKELAMLEAKRCLGCGPCSECLKNEELCETDKAIVTTNLCTGCNVCETVCPFGAINKNEMGIAAVNDALCKGCGICSTRCPERAISMQLCTDALIVTTVGDALRRDYE